MEYDTIDMCMYYYFRQINVEYDTIDEGETVARTYSDYWVVCRKSGHRRFFVLLNQKNANFAEINGVWLQMLEVWQ